MNDDKKVWAKCLKDGEESFAIFSLVFTGGKPSVLIDKIPDGKGQALARVVLINPEWLKPCQGAPFQYVYSGLIVIPKVQDN